MGAAPATDLQCGGDQRVGLAIGAGGLSLCAALEGGATDVGAVAPAAAAPEPDGCSPSLPPDRSAALGAKAPAQAAALWHDPPGYLEQERFVIFTHACPMWHQVYDRPVDA